MPLVLTLLAVCKTLCFSQSSRISAQKRRRGERYLCNIHSSEGGSFTLRCKLLLLINRKINLLPSCMRQIPFFVKSQSRKTPLKKSSRRFRLTPARRRPFPSIALKSSLRVLPRPLQIFQHAAMCRTDLRHLTLFLLSTSLHLKKSRETAMVGLDPLFLRCGPLSREQIEIYYFS